MTAKEIRKLRKKLDLTRRQFAEKLGVSKRTVEGWELGVKPSSLAVNAMLALSKK